MWINRFRTTKAYRIIMFFLEISGPVSWLLLQKEHFWIKYIKRKLLSTKALKCTVINNFIHQASHSASYEYTFQVSNPGRLVRIWLYFNSDIPQTWLDPGSEETSLGSTYLNKFSHSVVWYRILGSFPISCGRTRQQFFSEENIYSNTTCAPLQRLHMLKSVCCQFSRHLLPSFPCFLSGKEYKCNS